MSGESKRQPGRRRARLVRYAWVALVLAGGGGVAWAAEEIVVKTKTAEIMGGKSGLSKTVATLNQDDKVTVISREKGWLRVRAPNGQEGFIKEAALSTSALTAGGRPVGSAEASGATAGNAIKGIEPGAEKFVQEQRISPRTVSDVQRQIDLAQALRDQPATFQKFQQVGPVGAGQ